MDVVRNLKNIRIMGLSFLAFVLMLSYSISRPVTESLFLRAHSSKALPIVWLLVAIGVITVVVIYNRFVIKSELLKIFVVSSVISAAILIILMIAKIFNVPGVYYALYAWKDIYIIVLVEIYYSFANTVFPIKTARWAYGTFGLMGALGGILGNFTIGHFAKLYGSFNVLWVVPILLTILSIGIIPFSKNAGVYLSKAETAKKSNIIDALKVVNKSSYLTLVLILIAIVQIVVTLIDFKFNGIVEQSFPDVDVRTGIIGKIYAANDVATLVLYALVGPILRIAGVPATLIFIPIILGLGFTTFAVVPRFFMAAVVKVLSKCFDYTLFRAAKEILYIPLSYSEKTQGKSLVDMMTYRLAKGIASALLILLVLINFGWLATYITITLIVVWLFVISVIVKRFRKKVSRSEEMLG